MHFTTTYRKSSQQKQKIFYHVNVISKCYTGFYFQGQANCFITFFDPKYNKQMYALKIASTFYIIGLVCTSDRPKFRFRPKNLTSAVVSVSAKKCDRAETRVILNNRASFGELRYLLVPTCQHGQLISLNIFFSYI